jgi:hypothetical protein
MYILRDFVCGKAHASRRAQGRRSHSPAERLTVASNRHIQARIPAAALRGTTAVLLCATAALFPSYAQVFRGYSSSGVLEVKSRKDKRHETIKSYYPDGQVEFVATYRKGVLDGIVKEYYENGMLKAEIPYRDGRRDGVAKFYHDSGMLMCKVLYEDNEERRAKFYDDDGFITTSIDVDRDGMKLRKRGEKRRAEREADEDDRMGPLESAP